MLPNVRKGPAVVPSPSPLPALGCARLNRPKTGHFPKGTVTSMLSVVAQAGEQMLLHTFPPYCFIALAFLEVTYPKSSILPLCIPELLLFHFTDRCANQEKRLAGKSSTAGVGSVTHSVTSQANTEIAVGGIS